MKLSLMLQKSVRASMMNFCSLKHVRLGTGQNLTPAPLDFGRNVAPAAQVSSDGSVKGDDLNWLNNGASETYH